MSNIRFESNTANEIIQLLIDIRSNDAEIILQAIEKNQDTKNIERKFNRFKKAFNTMFYDKLSFKGISNNGNEKNIIFSKDNKEVSINDLSSGEKQIVFRGAFLLQNKDALNGAVVLIDEPEISMHPEWQKKIMDFYKKIFQNKKGEQTSQIIVTTHSPFIIHNENRYNDKVIVLKYNKIGGVVSSGYPEYYQANTVQAVEDAFNIPNFLSNANENIVFVEGKTDEQYFNKTIAVFEINNLPFKFKSIDSENSKNKSGGSSKLDIAYQAAQYMQLSHKYVFLYDCDKKKENQNNKNLYIYGLEQKLGDFNRGIEKGIENLLILNHEQLNELEIFKNF
ncbi:MAG: AAA family ATPase, partial [Neisseriaceae bacterium]|nr:AAA family ATPase [Neisseriaceae bacterium]